MKNLLERQKGITLIALVITIIVLLILAGVSIAMLSGQNGVLNRSQDAKLANTIGSFNEQTRLAAMSAKTSITAKMSNKAGYKATTSDNIAELATDVANGLGLTLSGNNTNGGEINTEGYTVAYYLDTPGDESTNGEGYIVIWFTNNSFRSTLKDRDEAMTNYSLTETISASSNQAEEEKNKSRNQAVLVAVIQIENYTCNLSATMGLTNMTNGGSDIGAGAFSGTTLNGDFGFTSTGTGSTTGLLTGITWKSGRIATTMEVGEDFTIGTENFRVLKTDKSSEIVAVPHYNITLSTTNPVQTTTYDTTTMTKFSNSKDWTTGTDDIESESTAYLLKPYIEAYSVKLNTATGNTGKITARLGKDSEMSAYGVTNAIRNPSSIGTYWLGSGVTGRQNYVCFVNNDGSINRNNAYDASYGMRPVVVIDIS